MLKNILSTAFDYLKENPGEWGFNLAYSPERTWNTKTEILLLTINPQSQNSRHEQIPNIPAKPFPEKHDFFKENNPFLIRKPIQGLLWELANLHNPDRTGEPLQKSFEFASNAVAMASFVPWRTVNQEKIKESQWNFAEKNIWKPIFEIWQPRLIIQIGRDPFGRLCKILNNGEIDLKEKYIKEYMPENSTPQKRNLKIRYGQYGKDKNKLLINLPHPVAKGYSGYPVNFPVNTHAQSPIGKFLKDMLNV